MKFDIETLLVAVIAVAATALAYVRQRKRSEGGDPGEGDDGAMGRSVPKPGSKSKPRPAARGKAGSKPAPAQPETSGADHEATSSQRRVTTARPAGPGGLLAGVRSWGYQLQKVKVTEVAASPFDLMVIDYSADGSAERAYKPRDLAQMQAKADGGRRLVLAYMSIGEAESYRYYWDPAWKNTPPAWIVAENPDWKENFAVRFWDPAWQNLFFGNTEAYVDRIIDAGFDGVYLDKCDVFEDMNQHYRAVAAERRDLEGDMVDFVARLSAHAKSRNPKFVIVMQNAEVLLEREELRLAIDGVAKEELLFGYSSPEKANPVDEVAFSKQALDLARKAGRAVFVVEYLSDRTKMRTALETLEGYGYVGTVSPKNRALDKLNPDPSSLA